MTALCEWTDRNGEHDRPAWQMWWLNRLITLVYWLTDTEPWQYYFGPPHADTPHPWTYLGNRVQTYLKTVRCRLRGHAGQVFYNPGGFEPDESCRNCGEPCWPQGH